MIKLIFIILSVAYYSYGFFEKYTWYESSKLYIKEEGFDEEIL